MSQPNVVNLTPEQQAAVLAELDRLRKENEVMKDKLSVGGRILQLFIGPSGGVSLRGFGRFPVTLFREGWEYLYSDKVKTAVLEFIETNEKYLKAKDEDAKVYEARIAKAIARDPKLKANSSWPRESRMRWKSAT